MIISVISLLPYFFRLFLLVFFSAMIWMICPISQAFAQSVIPSYPIFCSVSGTLRSCRTIYQDANTNECNLVINETNLSTGVSLPPKWSNKIWLTTDSELECAQKQGVYYSSLYPEGSVPSAPFSNDAQAYVEKLREFIGYLYPLTAVIFGCLAVPKILNAVFSGL
jgi:hypothetical protein